MFGIEGRYAHALFAVAAKQNSVEKVEKELADYQVNHSYSVHTLIKKTSYNSHQKLVTENQKLAEFIGNPTLNKRQKESEEKIIIYYLCIDLLPTYECLC